MSHLPHLYQLHTYAFFAPTIIRITAAVTLLIIAKGLYANRDTLLTTHFPIIGRPGTWMLWVKIGASALVGLALLVGYETQVAALLGMVLAFKHAFYARTYPNVVPLSRTANILLFFICLSLLITGAGALAWDLPL